ncbi:hypothetical protein I302_104622 [Kwoniella bestiolae CBS 10118]|uniref:Uncharacterized protein n=1 Tax=Kwoniella bestiolae CBS 10118 TaxID=1296100 RepID=A0A1B9GBS7_9TREE|nr:hypothetical protein I302_03330 [Kwoniella bestiolae CBS 10118]OCF28471.1 hypothetical protein I302_03330 [Kwoniella bestiolae CBS 10118]
MDTPPLAFYDDSAVASSAISSPSKNSGTSEKSSRPQSECRNLPSLKWTSPRVRSKATATTHHKLCPPVCTKEAAKRTRELTSLCNSIAESIPSVTSHASDSLIDLRKLPEKQQSKIDSSLSTLNRDSNTASSRALDSQLDKALEEQKQAYGQCTKISQEAKEDLFAGVYYEHVLQGVGSAVSGKDYKKSQLWRVGNNDIRKNLDKSLISGEWGVEFDEDTITGTLVTYDMENEWKDRRESKIIFNTDQSVDMILGKNHEKIRLLFPR